MLLLITSVFILFLPIILWYIQFFKYKKYLEKYPGPKPIPVLGNVHEFPSTALALPVFLKYQRIYGGTFRIYAAFTFCIVTTDYELTEYVLGSNKLIDKSVAYDSFLPWLGTGLLLSTGKKWKQHRKILTPAFHFQILEQFIDVFNSAGDILIGKLNQELNKFINVYPFINLCALDIICESAMGTKVNAQQHSKSKYVECIKEMSRIAIEKVASPVKQNVLTYHLTLDCYREKRALKVLHDYSNSIIKRRRQEFDSVKDQNMDEFGMKKRVAFLDILLQAQRNGEALSDNDIREEVDTFMFEGHDTVTSAISFAIMCLANHHEIQEKVINEFLTIFDGDLDKPLTYRSLQEMKYLEMVIKETLRLYPSVPFIGRALNEDIEFDGRVLPKGVTIGVFLYGIGRNPEVFPDPKTFDPERFNAENCNNRGPYSYVPFSAGPRNCIGQRFAMLEMKAIIFKVLKNFELFPAEQRDTPKLIAESVLKSSNGICIYLKNRL